MPACRYMEEIGLAAMLAAKSLAGVAPEMESQGTCMAHQTWIKRSALYLKSRQKSQTGVSVVPQKGLMSSKNVLLCHPLIVLVIFYFSIKVYELWISGYIYDCFIIKLVYRSKRLNSFMIHLLYSLLLMGCLLINVDILHSEQDGSDCHVFTFNKCEVYLTLPLFSML